MSSPILPLLSTILLLLLLHPLLSLTAKNCNSGDQKTLLSIKTSFKNPKILSTWTPTTPCCNWPFIRCLPATHRVVSLQLSASPALSGPIPTAVSRLPFLATLVLSDLPNLTGSIPSSLSLLSNLSTLIITNTSISGPIPPSLYKLRSLQLLRLSHNFLTGNIPQSFTDFDVSSPPILDLSNNFLVGGIPIKIGEIDWGSVDLSNNRLEGDGAMFLGEGKKITRLNLASNRLRFDLSYVRFPADLGVLYMQRNEISGVIPGQVNQLRHLIVLNLSDNELCGEIPAGPVTGKFGREAYEGNKCLCGAPLDPCTVRG